MKAITSNLFLCTCYDFVLFFKIKSHFDVDEHSHPSTTPLSSVSLCLAVNRLLLLSREGKWNKMGNFVVFFFKVRATDSTVFIKWYNLFKEPSHPPRHIIKRFSHKHDPSNIQAKCLHVQSAAHTLH